MASRRMVKVSTWFSGTGRVKRVLRMWIRAKKVDEYAP